MIGPDDHDNHDYLDAYAVEMGKSTGQGHHLGQTRPNKGMEYLYLLLIAPLTLIFAGVFILGTLTQELQTGMGVSLAVVFLCGGALVIANGIKQLRASAREEEKREGSRSTRKRKKRIGHH